MVIQAGLSPCSPQNHDRHQAHFTRYNRQGKRGIQCWDDLLLLCWMQLDRPRSKTQACSLVARFQLACKPPTAYLVKQSLAIMAVSVVDCLPRLKSVACRLLSIQHLLALLQLPLHAEHGTWSVILLINITLGEGISAVQAS